MLKFVLCSLLLAGIAVPGGASAQDQPSSPDATQPAFPADYPQMQAGILIHTSSWMSMTNQVPSKTKVAHSFAASLSYGIVPGKIVAEYAGPHAPTEVNIDQPVICICHVLSLPGKPLIVRLHPKKGRRELNGGKIIEYPLVGGSGMANASKSDWIPTAQKHPDPQVWLIRALSPLAPGEYAVMFGTENLNIYPFTVTSSAGAVAAK